MNYILNNDLVFYSLFTVSISLITVNFIKSKFLNSSVIETPNSPPTFNFSIEQLKEVQDILERGDQLDPETEGKLDQDIKKNNGRRKL
jgi:hypothetical protein